MWALLLAPLLATAAPLALKPGLYYGRGLSVKVAPPRVDEAFTTFELRPKDHSPFYLHFDPRRGHVRLEDNDQTYEPDFRTQTKDEIYFWYGLGGLMRASDGHLALTFNLHDGRLANLDIQLNLAYVFMLAPRLISEWVGHTGPIKFTYRQEQCRVFLTVIDGDRRDPKLY